SWPSKIRIVPRETNSLLQKSLPLSNRNPLKSDGKAGMVLLDIAIYTPRLLGQDDPTFRGRFFRGEEMPVLKDIKRTHTVATRFTAIPLYVSLAFPTIMRFSLRWQLKIPSSFYRIPFLRFLGRPQETQRSQSAGAGTASKATM